MQKDYWLEKWQKGDTKFNQDQVHPSLPAYFGELEPGCVLVPLCGKTIDMLWLAKQGHKVIGCELSEIPCRAFFEENKVRYTKESFTLSGGQSFTVFRADLIEIWCGDFFEVPLEKFENITAIYDRAAIVALPQGMRTRYADKICEIAKNSEHELSYLLLTFEYNQNLVEGPPFNVSQAEVHQLFDSTFDFKRADIFSDKALGNNPKFGGVPALEILYLMSKAHR